MLFKNLGLICSNIVSHILSLHLPFLGPGLSEERPFLSNRKQAGRKEKELN